MEKEILKRIEEGKKDYDRKSQYVNLLKRNEMFLTEYNGIMKRLGKEFFQVKKISKRKLEKISEDNILIKLGYPEINFFAQSKYNELKSNKERYEIIKIKGKKFIHDTFQELNEIEKDPFFTGRDLDLIYEKKTKKIDKIIRYRNEILNKYKDAWNEFCLRWGISPGWSGNLTKLSKHVRSSIELCLDDNDYHFPIMIKIGTWTTFDDIKKKWKEIEGIQKEFYFKLEMSSNFSRDLCWYDLRKNFKLSYGKIAKLWIENFPEDIDLLVLPRIIRKYKIFENVPYLEVIKEIKSDDLQLNEIKKEFNQEKEYYIKGPYSSFKDVIKKSIKRMELKIEKLNISPIGTG